MLTVAYLANQIPSPTEHYVTDEIEELRRRGVRVITCSVRESQKSAREAVSRPEIVLQKLQLGIICGAIWLLISRANRMWLFWRRIFTTGSENFTTRLKAVVHTILGACYAVKLKGRQVDHIHVHHGYFGSWIAMVAARLLEIRFSVTLHGSDLLLHGVYLDTKLEHCSFCLTISEYNRCFLTHRYPQVADEKICVSRLGVEVDEKSHVANGRARTGPLTLLAVGRLHKTKDHAFLIRACSEIRQAGMDVECSIAGDGPERRRLQALIEESGLVGRVTLLGYVSREQIGALYDRADIVVLTSRSEGIPLVLMEAMARGKIVLAPAITGIPELVVHGKSGFLFQPNSMPDFIEQSSFLYSLIRSRDRADAGCLDWIRHAAHMQVHHSFNRKTNLDSFANLFLSRVQPRKESLPHEDLVLQQI